MIKFSQFEKGLIFRITEGVNTMADLCKVFLNQARINIKQYDKNAEIMIPEETHDLSIITEIIDDISRKTLTAVRLIEQLHKDGYIILYKSSVKIEDPFTFGPEIKHTAFNYHPFSDQHIVNLLLTYIDKRILVTQSLQEFVNFGFMSVEEIIQNKKIRAAWYTVYVSLFIGISVIIINIYFTLSKDTKIDRAQFDIIINQTNSLSDKLKSISNTLKDITIKPIPRVPERMEDGQSPKKGENKSETKNKKKPKRSK